MNCFLSSTVHHAKKKYDLRPCPTRCDTLKFISTHVILATKCGSTLYRRQSRGFGLRVNPLTLGNGGKVALIKVFVTYCATACIVQPWSEVRLSTTQKGAPLPCSTRRISTCKSSGIALLAILLKNICSSYHGRTRLIVHSVHCTPAFCSCSLNVSPTRSPQFRNRHRVQH